MLSYTDLKNRFLLYLGCWSICQYRWQVFGNWRSFSMVLKTREIATTEWSMNAYEYIWITSGMCDSSSFRCVAIFIILLPPSFYTFLADRICSLGKKRNLSLPTSWNNATSKPCFFICFRWTWCLARVRYNVAISMQYIPSSAFLNESNIQMLKRSEFCFHERWSNRSRLSRSEWEGTLSCSTTCRKERLSRRLQETAGCN